MKGLIALFIWIGIPTLISYSFDITSNLWQLLLCGAFGVLAVLFYCYASLNAEGTFDINEEAGDWFRTHEIDIDSIMFNTFSSEKSSRVTGSTIVVGVGKRKGESVGFAIEFLQGQGVLEYEEIEPSGIASHSSKYFATSNATGVPLLDILAEQAHNHRERLAARNT